MARNFTAASNQYLNTAFSAISGEPFTMACWCRTTTSGVITDADISSSGLTAADVTKLVTMAQQLKNLIDSEDANPGRLWFYDEQSAEELLT